MAFAISHPVIGEADVTLTPAHRFFEHVVVAEAGLTGYINGHMLQAGNMPSPGPIRHVCFVEQAEIECDVSPLLRAIVAQSWPASVRMRVCAMPQPAASGRTSSPNGVQRLTGSIHAHAFLTYYENVKHEMEARHGNDPERWPETLKFARMTRNAFGHGGMLDIRNPKATATWRGLSMSNSNNGEQLIYNHLASGDVVLLMMDVEDHL